MNREDSEKKNTTVSKKDVQGLILLDKPQNITSFGAVAAIRKLVHSKRVGHTGTLDPMATGVLPIFVGRATSLSGILIDGDKRYTAGIKLGVVTDTDDITGEIISEKEVNVTASELQAAINKFIGKIQQIPPIYSAIKKDGVRLYKLAREGKTADIPPRDVEIFSLDLLSSPDRDNIFYLDAFVSKGTYIRSLARDIGEFLGCGATLVSLRRTLAAGFDIKDCIPLDVLTEDNIADFIHSEEKAVLSLREINITHKQAVRFCNGGQLDFERLKISDFKDNELLRVKLGDRLLGIGIADCQNNFVAIKCILSYPEDE